MPSEGPEAYYLPRGNGRYEPTWATESPWDRKAQHGGPPAALLAHVIDQAVEVARAAPPPDIDALMRDVYVSY